MKRLVLMLATACPLLVGQTAASVVQGGQNAPPVYVLYRMLFQRVAGLDQLAANLDSASQPGGAAVRGQFQAEMGMSDAEVALVKAGAASCNSQLAAVEATAQQTITAAKALSAATSTAGVPVAPSPATLATLAQLEQQRTDISNACIQALQSALKPVTFQNIDIYVKTALAGKTAAVRPPMYQQTAPLSAAGAKP